MYTTVVVQWNMYMQYGKHIICCGAYANNVKCMYSIFSGHIVDCSEFL